MSAAGFFSQFHHFLSVESHVDEGATRYEVIDFDIDSTEFTTQFLLVYESHCAPYLREEQRDRTAFIQEHKDGSRKEHKSKLLVCSMILALPRSVDLTSLLTAVNTENLSRISEPGAARTSVVLDSDGSISRTEHSEETRQSGHSRASTWTVQVVRQLDSIWPHVTTEQMPKSYSEYRFGVYSLRFVHNTW